jgi:hypothetical protein
MHDSMKVSTRSGSIVPHVLHLEAAQRFKLRPFYPRENSLQYQSAWCNPASNWTWWQTEKSLPLPGIKPRSSTRSLSFHWVNYLISNIAVFLDTAQCSLVRNRPDEGGSSTPETSVNFCQTTQYNIPEECHLHTRHCENLAPHLTQFKTTTLIVNIPHYYLPIVTDITKHHVWVSVTCCVKLEGRKQCKQTAFGLAQHQGWETPTFKQRY